MRILWFTNTSAGYSQAVQGYNGGGWITALSDQVEKKADIQLAVSFFLPGRPFMEVQEGITYYAIELKKRFISRLHRFLNKELQETAHIEAFKKVIDDFRPDVIHIFGSERTFGLITPHTRIPVVIHLQGLLIPYLNAYVPPSYSKFDVICQNGFSLKKMYKNYQEFTGWTDSAAREKRIMSNCKYFMGRTQWDKRVSKLYAPDSQYFYCGEMLRESFYNSSMWQPKVDSSKIKIVSVISSPLYKGADMLLKTALILQRDLKLNFEWHVYGNSNLEYASKKLGIELKSFPVFQMGVANSNELVIALKECHVYFHPSYIDNSPNSICEAQVMGVPVIACNVGGVSSIIEHFVTGILIPSNDPYIGASYIHEIIFDSELNIKISRKAREIARKRHNKNKIVNDLTEIYNSIIKKSDTHNGTQFGE